jgi:hypothetical protein
MLHRRWVVVLCFLCLTLAGCLEVEEKVSLAPSGEGTIQFRMRLPIAMEGGGSTEVTPAQTAEELSKQLAGFRNVDVTSSSSFGQTIIAVKATAPSLVALAPFYGPLMKREEKEKSQDALASLTPKNFYTMKRKGDRLIITRTFLPPPQKKAKKQTEEEKNAAAFAGMMGSVFMRFTLEVPGKVLSSNAEEASDGRLTWVVPASYFQTNKVTFTAEIEAEPALIKALEKGSK